MTDRLDGLYRDLAPEVARLETLHGERLRCARGCADCCVDGITVFAIEAERIRRRHGGLLRDGSPHPPGACAFLSEDRSCRIYDDRPYVCRTQGLPLRWIDAELEGETVELRDICPLNDNGTDLTAIDADRCFFLGPFEERLASLQSGRGGGEGDRVALRDLFRREENEPSSLGPVEPSERIEALDVLRGVAVLAILVMNIYAFAMPFQATANPLIVGGSSGADLWTWYVSHVFFEQKFMTVFSMLFGAGIVLMHRRAEARGAPVGPVFVRRQLWLAFFGILHGYLLWFGDILYTYGVCGLAVFPLRRWPARRLLAAGLAAMLVVPLLMFALGTGLAQRRDLADEALAAERRGEALDEEQRRAIEEWEESSAMFSHSPEVIRRDIEVHRGGWAGIARERAPLVFVMQTVMLLLFGLGRVGGLMLVGMALMKLGVVTAARSTRFYAVLLACGWGIGLPLAALSARTLARQGFDPVRIMRDSGNLNYAASAAVCLGHIAAVMLFVRGGALRWLRSALGAVGRIALTNYLLHSIVFTTLFYGYGAALYGRLGRVSQMGCVVAMWGLQLAASPLWLRRFRFGPFEWLWRSLTYRGLQPFVRRRPR